MCEYTLHSLNLAKYDFFINWSLETKFNETLIEIRNIPSAKMHLKIFAGFNMQKSLSNFLFISMVMGVIDYIENLSRCFG